MGQVIISGHPSVKVAIESILTTRGDILHHNGTEVVRLPIGSDNQIARVATDILAYELDFDATAPVDQAFADVAAAGVATVAARRDHVHGMMDDPAPNRIVKASDETVANSTTLQDDDDFSFAVDANTTYLVTMNLGTANLQNGGLKAAWSLPAGATVKWNAMGAVQLSSGPTSVVSVARATGTSNIVDGAASLAIQFIVLTAVITVAATAGTAQWQWAQGLSDAVGSIVEADSEMLVHRV